MSAESELARLRLSLPEVPKPVGSYASLVESG